MNRSFKLRKPLKGTPCAGLARAHEFVMSATRPNTLQFSGVRGGVPRKGSEKRKKGKKKGKDKG